MMLSLFSRYKGNFPITGIYLSTLNFSIFFRNNKNFIAQKTRYITEKMSRLFAELITYKPPLIHTTAMKITQQNGKPIKVKSDR